MVDERSDHMGEEDDSAPQLIQINDVGFLVQGANHLAITSQNQEFGVFKGSREYVGLPFINPATVIQTLLDCNVFGWRKHG